MVGSSCENYTEIATSDSRGVYKLRGLVVCLCTTHTPHIHTTHTSTYHRHMYTHIPQTHVHVHTSTHTYHRHMHTHIQHHTHTYHTSTHTIHTHTCTTDTCTHIHTLHTHIHISHTIDVWLHNNVHLSITAIMQVCCYSEEGGGVRHCLIHSCQQDFAGNPVLLGE